MDSTAGTIKKNQDLVIVRLLGGLGNQMFQYALGRSLSLVLGWPLKLDTNFYKGEQHKWAQRSFDLQQFNFQAEIATEEELAPFKKYLQQNFFSKILRRASVYWPLDKNYLFEPIGTNFVFNPEILKIKPKQTVYLDGFWQTEKYFRKIEDVIRKDFVFRNLPDPINQQMLQEIQNRESVAVHIRHGDNATKIAAKHGVLPLEYYTKSVKQISTQVNNAFFYIFSDDPDWVRKNLHINFPHLFVEHNGSEKGYEDLRLMANCRHHIIGNSTFSWWGAWLAKHPEQKVLAPEKYHMAATIPMADYYLSTWQIVKL